MSVHGYIKKRIFSSDCVLDYSKYVSGVIVTALSKWFFIVQISCTLICAIQCDSLFQLFFNMSYHRMQCLEERNGKTFACEN